MLARVPEATARDIEAAHLRSNRCADENHSQRGQDRQSAAINKTEDEREPAKNFQPRQIKREADADKPRKRFVIIDVESELDRIEHFYHAGVNKNPSDDQIEDSPNPNLHRLNISTPQHLNDSSSAILPSRP